MNCCWNNNNSSNRLLFIFNLEPRTITDVFSMSIQETKQSKSLMKVNNNKHTQQSSLRSNLSDGWETLKLWGEVAVRVEPLTGGVANDVWKVCVDGLIAVGRLGSRSDADLAWEMELMLYLDQKGLAVPLPIPTMDGRLFVDGLVVMTYVEGDAPQNPSEWSRVADTLRTLHQLTKDWPQRPGWCSSQDLLRANTGTKVDLTSMPAEGVTRCRKAWSRLKGYETSVIHGDAGNPGNVRITSERVALIDWDEAHVDVPLLDLVLPHNAGGFIGDEFDIATQASAAWEAAVCWDDDYSKRRLAEVHD